MTTKDEALALALEALESEKRWHRGDKWRHTDKHEEWSAHDNTLDAAITAIQQAQKAQQVPESAELMANGRNVFDIDPSFVWSFLKLRSKFDAELMEAAWNALVKTAESNSATKQAEPAWQPIETAPKDGKILLGVWEGDWNNPKQQFRVYEATIYKTGPSWAMKGNYRTEEGGAYKIAGWMPLPPAPEAT